MSGGAQKQSGGGGHGSASSERWLLTYADLITLLMVFFIVMYTMSELDKEKYAQVASYLAVAFGGEPTVLRGSGLGTGFVPIRPGDLRESAPPPDPLQMLGQELRLEWDGEGRFTVRVAQRGLIISLVGSAAFDSGDAEIRPEFLPLLDAIAERLRRVEYDISIEGFTDTDPIRTAEYPSNWYLSTARANRVRDYLERQGVDGSRMMVVGYGETRPAWSNTSLEGKARNRRVDVVILRQRQQVELGQEIESDNP